MDQRGGKQSPPSLSWLSALYKCLFVVKSRVKAPPCGRSLALAQVNTVVDPQSITPAGPAQPPKPPHNLGKALGAQEPQTPCAMTSFEAYCYRKMCPPIVNTHQL